MADRDKTTGQQGSGSGADVTAEELLAAHPVEPAEGSRKPGEDADDPRPPHSAEPAEGER